MELYNLNYLKFDLQFFAKDGEGGEKTEEPTAKKIEDARKEGQVAKSKELTNALSLLSLFICLKLFMGFVGRHFIDLFYGIWKEIPSLSTGPLNSIRIWQLFLSVFVQIMIISGPFMAVAFVVSFFSQKIQIKWKVTSKPLQPKLNKINPLSGFKRLFSKQALFDLILSIIKIAIFSYVSYSVLKDNWSVLFTLYSLNIQDSLGILFDLVMELGIKISVVYIIISLADWAFQKWKHKEDLRMTKQEVKDEYKNQEGDPKIKGQQRQRMRDASRRRMMDAVPDADVVITNPTHFAVAIKYDSLISQAPLVVAKGADFMAFKIREIAKEHNVEIKENKELARILYANVEIGTEIPTELYQAVAEILAAVYRDKNKIS